MASATRFWFKTSDLYMQGPFVLVGILAESWDDAKGKACGPNPLPEANRHLGMPNNPYFLSCNVIEVAEHRGDADPSPVLVRDERKPLPGPDLTDHPEWW